MKTYLFIDAENHFLRATAVAEEIIGSPNAACAMSKAKLRLRPISGFPDDINGERFGWDPEIQLFWDCELLSRGSLLIDLQANVARAIYACACTGDEDKAHEMRVRLRNYGFEPLVVREPKNLRQKRVDARERLGLIEKPKGCDIAIATRMVADAATDLYECCFLFTSDADFLPAIEAVRRMGKVVWVFGFASALPERSPYLYVPDRFVDLRPHLESVWRNKRSQISEALSLLGTHRNVKDDSAA
jgi:uncharacterized LabA/DUF88 family protein